MAKMKKITPKLGDHVKIRYGPEVPAQVIEERGPLGPNGALVFRIRVEYDPEPRFVEVLEEELELIPEKPKVVSGRSPAADSDASGRDG
jgi:hypothetical protein